MNTLLRSFLPQLSWFSLSPRNCFPLRLMGNAHRVSSPSRAELLWKKPGTQCRPQSHVKKSELKFLKTEVMIFHWRYYNFNDILMRPPQIMFWIHNFIWWLAEKWIDTSWTYTTVLSPQFVRSNVSSNYIILVSDMCAMYLLDGQQLNTHTNLRDGSSWKTPWSMVGMMLPERFLTKHTHTQQKLTQFCPSVVQSVQYFNKINVFLLQFCEIT